MDRIVAAQVFVTIAERGSLSGAAESLDMSRAMVTRYLAEMEGWSGARLFHRTTRRINLTVAGEATLMRCREMLALAEQMPMVGDTEVDDPRGILRIVASGSRDRLFAPLPADCDRPADRQPGGESGGRAHRSGNPHHQPTRSRRDRPSFGQLPLGGCASPAYLKEHGTPKRAEDLALHNCLTYTYFGKSLWNFERAGKTISVPVSGNLSANESVVLLQAAVEGAGIAMQPVFSAAPLIASGHLAALLPNDTPQTMGIHGLYTSRRHQPAIMRTMLDFLVKWFADPGHIAHRTT